jgi:hypothetical protein
MGEFTGGAEEGHQYARGVNFAKCRELYKVERPAGK